MRVLSLFSGIEAASVAWEALGWEIVAIAEVEPFACKVLAHKYPNVPNLGDVTKITAAQIVMLGRIDLVVFGSPCQDLSVAGKRKGLAGERSGLFHTAMQIVQWARLFNECRFALWENVPGAFSSHKGADFAAVVREMGGFEYSPDVPRQGWGNEGVALGKEALVEWSTLDAQWFGVAQRRRRVFALADFGNWYDRPPILLECQSLRGDTAPSRKTGEEVAPTIRAGAPNGGAGHGARSGDSKDELIVPVATASTGTDVHAVACFKGGQGSKAGGIGYDEHVSPTLSSADSGTNRTPALLQHMQVRRLTPKECERLQGFRDEYTNIPGASDGSRYKALGNSMAVPVMRWIGKRIKDAVTVQELLTDKLV